MARWTTALGQQRGHQDLGVETDRHETIVKTSSSV
jgi:hypothetical protein